MWREYTRETPARPGLAILAAALALIGTTALAWVVVQRANPRRVEAPAYWPIRFTLPDRYERTVIDYGESAIELIDGSIGAALYTSGGPDETIGFIHVRYELLPKSTNFNDAAEVLTGADFSTSMPTAIGPLPGRIIEKHVRRGAVNLIAFGMTEDGLAISLDYVAAAGGGADLSRFRQICESVEFRDWYTPRPPWVSSFGGSHDQAFITSRDQPS